MNKVMLGIFAVFTLVVVCLVPVMSEETDAGGNITHSGTSIFKTSSSQTFDIVYSLEEGDTSTITYTAKVVNSDGNTSGVVSPSSGSLTTKVHKTLTVTAPSTKGNYTLVVEFKLTDSEKKVKTETQKYNFTVVTPITLKVNLKATDVTIDMQSFGVFFYVDGEKIEDSYSTVTLSSNGTGSVSYEWIANPSNGKHTFHVEAPGNTQVIKGLGVEHTFYIGDNDYTLVIAALAILVIALIAIAIYIFSKPIKNYGKPKSRR